MPTWTGVSSLRNYVIGDPILDWLELYGEASGFKKDTDVDDYTPQADLGLFVRKKAKEFESRVIELINGRVDLAMVKGAASNEDDFYEQTLRLMREGREAIFQGLVRDPESSTFGVPDLIILGRALATLSCAPIDGLQPRAYYILDIKFKGLSLNKNGSLNSNNKWEKVQLSLYEKALASMSGRVPGKAFLLGRALSGRDGAGGGCFDQFGWTDANDPKVWETISEALSWQLDLAANGATWTPGEGKLFPGDNSQDGPWHDAKKQIAEGLQTSSSSGPDVSPARVMANRDEWFVKPELEFFVDFETVNSMNDDFKSLPQAGGTPFIFMIGCGHEENGEWHFEVWSAQHETYDEELRVIQQWLEHMEATRQRLAPNSAPKVFHWHSHEPQELGKAADRHQEDSWRDLNWFDLLKEVMRKEPVAIRGISGMSLKPVTKMLHEMGHIQTVWGDSPVADGVAAMAAAWWVYEQGRATDRTAAEVSVIGSNVFLMREIENYNEVDCKAMWEILNYLRKNH